MPATPSREELRRTLRRRRRALTMRQRRQAALALSRRLLSDPRVRRARHIAIYRAQASELSLQPFGERALDLGKRLYLPRVDGRQLNFLPAASPPRRNRFGITEPWRGRVRPPWAMDLILVPLVGIDRHGNRLGQGGGYYDRTLARLRFRRPRLIGIAYDGQIVDALAPAPWDVPLDAAFTPSRTLDFRTPPHGLLADENRAE